MIDLKDRAELEVKLAKNLDFVVDQLVDSNFSDEDIVIFTDTVKTALKYQDLKQFIVDTLHDKIIEVSKIIKIHDKIRFQSFKKLIQIIFDLGDEELIDSLETYLARNRKPYHLFIFIEEKIARGASIEKTEQNFIDLMGINDYNAGMVDNFLSIVKKDKTYFIQLLLNQDLDSSIGKNRFVILKRYLRDLLETSVESVGEHVIPVFINRLEGHLPKYLELVREIVERTSIYTHILLKNDKFNCQSGFEVYMLAGYTYNMGLILNYFKYLAEHNPDGLNRVEDLFLGIADSSHIVDYAIIVPTSKKRKVLKRLIELKEENQLVEFIENFPEYKSLLPML